MAGAKIGLVMGMICLLLHDVAVRTDDATDERLDCIADEVRRCRDRLVCSPCPASIHPRPLP